MSFLESQVGIIVAEWEPKISPNIVIFHLNRKGSRNCRSLFLFHLIQINYSVARFVATIIWYDLPSVVIAGAIAFSALCISAMMNAANTHCGAECADLTWLPSVQIQVGPNRICSSGSGIYPDAGSLLGEPGAGRTCPIGDRVQVLGSWQKRNASMTASAPAAMDYKDLRPADTAIGDDGDVRPVPRSRYPWRRHYRLWPLSAEHRRRALLWRCRHCRAHADKYAGNTGAHEVEAGAVADAVAHHYGHFDRSNEFFEDSPWTL